MSIVLCSADLATASKVAAAAARVGTPLEVALGVEALLAKAAADSTTLVVLDLTTPGLDPGDVLQRLRAARQPAPRTIAFGPHVHEQQLAAAREAGCAAVYARGQFHAQLDAILREQQAPTE